MLALYLLAALAAMESVVAPSATTESAVTLEAILAQRVRGPAELRAEAEIAAARRTLAEVGARQREAPTLAVEAGPRRSDGSVDADLAVDFEVALLRRGDERQALVAALAAAE